MVGKALQLTLRELRTMFSSPATLGALAAIVLVLGISGPFGTQDRLNLAECLVYWLIVVGSSSTIGFATIFFASQVLKPRLASSTLRIGIGGVLAGTLLTGLMKAIDAVALGQNALAALPELWVNCVIITLAVSLIGVQVRRRTTSAPLPVAQPASAPSQAPPALLDRLPLPLRGTLWALVVSDHYVEVWTERGTHLILMRLSDAIKEAAGEPGLQIHRSHWVALGAVTRTLKSEGKPMVELPDGRRLPISRSYLDAARGAGLA